MTTTLALPNVLSVGLARSGIELRQFFRHKDQVVFTFTFPALILMLLGSVFTDAYGDTGATSGQVFVASMAGAGIVSTSFLTLGIGVAEDRADGTLKRLRGAPVPLSAYFIGKIVLVVVASLAELILLFAVGMVMFDTELPGDAQRWFTLGWVFLLGTVSCALLGLAISSFAKNAQSAGAITNLPYIGLLFVSGVYIPIVVLPGWMLDIGALFPVKWVAQGFRSALLPDGMSAYEAAGSWELGATALVLGGWCVVGLLLCLLTFRMTSRKER
ncbi:ABC transporter permease [Actinophytocola sediminis]